MYRRTDGERQDVSSDPPTGAGVEDSVLENLTGQYVGYIHQWSIYVILYVKGRNVHHSP
jgi:hypothetical protein